MLVTYRADGMFIASDVRYRKGQISAKNRMNRRLSGRPNLVSMLNQHMPGSYTAIELDRCFYLLMKHN
jgi:hypothetical protein